MNNEIEARPFEEYKEMIRSMPKEEMIKGLYDLSKSCIEKDNEIERLINIINDKSGVELDYFIEGLRSSIKERDLEIERLYNIINELEKHVEDSLKLADENETEDTVSYVRDILNKLQELKGDSSNE